MNLEMIGIRKRMANKMSLIRYFWKYRNDLGTGIVFRNHIKMNMTFLKEAVGEKIKLQEKLKRRAA